MNKTSSKHIATGANLAKIVFYFRKKIQKNLDSAAILPFYVVKITQKSKQNEPGQNAQDSLVFSKLRYCALVMIMTLFSKLLVISRKF